MSHDPGDEDKADPVYTFCPTDGMEMSGPLVLCRDEPGRPLEDARLLLSRSFRRFSAADLAGDLEACELEALKLSRFAVAIANDARARRG